MSTCAGTTSNTAQVNKLCGGFLSAMAGSVAQPAYICGKNYVHLKTLKNLDFNKNLTFKNNSLSTEYLFF